MFTNRLKSTTSDDVVLAQVRALQTRIPITHGILALNTAIMVVTHWGEGSSTITFYLPAIVIALMCVRAIQWANFDSENVTVAKAREMLRSTISMSFCFSAALMSWACYMYNVPVAYDAPGITGYGHAVLYVSLTVVCCISLLLPVRAAALVVAATVMVPFPIFLFENGSFVERAVAVNIALVAAGMLHVVHAFSRDYEELIVSRRETEIAASRQAKLALIDPLTGLGNRRNFFEVLTERCAHRLPFSLFMIDLDGFKQVNDLHGHLVGDGLLVQIAERIACSYGERLSLARIGGDEFAIICGVLDPVTVLERAERVISACREPITIGSATVTVGASIGTVIVRADDFIVDPSKHIERADYALSHAKLAGKGVAELFTPEHEARIRRQGLVEQALLRADFAAEINVFYQAIVRAETREVIGYEALARWTSAELGSVPPSEFVPLAEKNGTVHQLTKVVLQKALQHARSWPSHVRLKVNLSGRDLANMTQMLKLLGILEDAVFDPRRVTFELTETSVVNDFPSVIAAINLFRRAGVQFAIDDFGTGYSSLNYVHALEPDLIKIDRSFVSKIGTGENVECVIKTIIELCKNLGAKSLAEGVETEEQAEVLVALGVNELQGYLIARPRPFDQLHPALLTRAVTA